MKKIFVATSLLSVLGLASLTALAQSREALLSQIETKRAELAALEKNFLAPSEADRAQFAEFLRYPDTGLVRLLPRENFDAETYRNIQKNVTVRGGGAYYSFTRLTHDYGDGSDIEFAEGNFLSGFAGQDIGLFANLGDVPLDSISLKIPAAMTLATSPATGQQPQARQERQRLANGGELGGVAVKRMLPAQLNSTYLLRTIKYSGFDVLVAFRVVRFDSDGSAILLWKLLKKTQAAQVAEKN